MTPEDLFAQLDCLRAIREYARSLETDDSESSRFEFKTCTTKKPILDKESKKLLGKEISAFANTYGGVIVFHMGVGVDIVQFPVDQINRLHAKLENWLGNCLDPAAYGIDLKPVEGILLILVLESKTKPHQHQGAYFYRLASTSRPMPELMVSAMYRARGVLTFDYELSFRCSVSLTIFTKIVNTSRIAGTKPQIKLKFINLVHNPGFGYKGDGVIQSNEEMDVLNVGYENRCDYTYTSTALASEVLCCI